MKIACLANMNNFAFSIVRHLRDRGYDAHLFLVKEFDHFLPMADSYEETAPSYIHQLDWYETGHWAVSKEKIKKDMQGFDFLIGSDHSPAYLRKAGITLDIFSPHGSDIFRACYYKFQGFPPKRYEIGDWWRSRQQRTAVRKAGHIMLDFTNEWLESFITDLDLNKKRLMINAPYIYPQQYNEQNFSKSEHYDAAKRIRINHDLVLFQQCRQEITPGVEYKGNDLVIKAYARFVTDSPDVKSLLILFEYGTDVEKSKKLVNDLGISNKVLWLPLMKKKDLMVWLSICDMGIGEVGNSYLSYTSVYEILAMKKPFLGYRRDEEFEKYYPELYPMASENTADGIYRVFNDLHKNPEKYKKMGLEANRWFMKYAVELPVNKIVELIEQKKNKLNNTGIQKNDL